MDRHKVLEPPNLGEEVALVQGRIFLVEYGAHKFGGTEKLRMTRMVVARELDSPVIQGGNETVAAAVEAEQRIGNSEQVSCHNHRPLC